MAADQTPAQKKTVARVMHEFKHGELRQNDGAVVTDPKQAIAVALSEAGASDRVDDDTNRRNHRRTKGRERRGVTPQALHEGTSTRAALYAEARRRDIPGRSGMTKAELQKALLK
jgi:hypothetical protein